MAAPVIEAADVTESGVNSAESSWVVDHPAYVAGDLLILHVAQDKGAFHTPPAAGPNGETVVEIDNDIASSSDVTVSVWYWIGTGTVSAGTVTVTTSNAQPWLAAVAKVPAGEFDATTPIDSFSQGDGGGGNVSSVPSPAWTGTAADARVVAWLGIDADPVTGTPAGWTDVSNVDIGAVASVLSTRDAATTASESIASASWTIDSDQYAAIGYAINAPASSGVTASGTLTLPAPTLTGEATFQSQHEASGTLTLPAPTLTGEATFSEAAPAPPLSALTGVSLGFGLLKMDSDYSGPCCEVRRSIDNSVTDIGFSGTPDANGFYWIDESALETFVGAGTGYVVTLYDQSGNSADAAQATESLQPIIVREGVTCKHRDWWLNDYLDIPCLECADDGAGVKYLKGTAASALGTKSITVAALASRWKDWPNQEGANWRDVFFSFTDSHSNTSFSSWFSAQIVGDFLLMARIGGVSGSKEFITPTGESNPQTLTWFPGLHILRSGDTSSYWRSNTKDLATGSNTSLGTQKTGAAFWIGYGFGSPSHTGTELHGTRITAVAVYPTSLSDGDTDTLYNSFAAATGVGIQTTDINSGLFNPTMDWEQTIYDWLATIEESDVTITLDDFTWDETYDDEEALYEWYRVIYKHRNRFRDTAEVPYITAGPEWFVLDDGAGAGIEGSGSKRLWQTDADYRASRFTLWLHIYDWALPDSGVGAGNPYYHHSGLATRLLVGACAKLLVEEQGSNNSTYCDGIHQGAYFDVACVFKRLGSLLPSDVLAAVKLGMMRGIDKVAYNAGSHRKHLQANMVTKSMPYLTAMWHVMDGDTVSQDYIVDVAKRVLFGELGTTVTTSDKVYGIYSPTGYIAEGNMPEGEYAGDSLQHLSDAFLMVPTETDWEFLSDVMRECYELKSLMAFGDETMSGIFDGSDNPYVTGPSGCDSRTGAGYVAQGSSEYNRDLSVAAYLDEALPEVRSRNNNNWGYERSTATMVSEINSQLAAMSAVYTTPSVDTPQPLSKHWTSHWPEVVVNPLKTGWFAAIEALIDAEDESLIIPFHRTGGFSLDRGEFWFHKAQDSGGRWWGFCLETIENQQQYAGFYGGILNTFWTEETGPLIMTRKNKSGDDPPGETSRTWAQLDGGWTTEHFWGVCPTGRFSSADYGFENTCSPQVSKSYGDPNPNVTYTMEMGEAAGSGAQCQETGEELSGDYTLSKTWTALQDGLQLAFSFSKNSGSDDASELWWSFPVFLQDEGDTRFTAPDATIDYWTGSAWATMTPGTVYVASKIRIGQDPAQDSTYAYIYVHFGSAKNVRANATRWVQHYQTSHAVRMIDVDLHPASGLESEIPNVSFEATFSTVADIGDVFTATGTLTLPAPTLAGEATFTAQFTASGTLTLPAPTLTGEATFTSQVSASGTLTLPAPTLTGEATFAPLRTASGTLTLPAPTVTGAAHAQESGHIANGVLTLPAPTLSGAAYTVDVSGTSVKSHTIIKPNYIYIGAGQPVANLELTQGDTAPFTIYIVRTAATATTDAVMASFPLDSQISIVLVDPNTGTAVGPVSCSNATDGADWLNGAIAAKLNATQANALTPGPAIAQIQAIVDGDLESWNIPCVTIVKDYITS